MLTPLASLVEAGIADGRADGSIWPEEIGQAAKPDVVVWQRQIEDAQIAMMRKWRTMLPDALFIYELDDYLSGIPDASFHASFMPPDVDERLRKVLPICNRVTTTTEPLSQWLQSLGATGVRVVPNALPQARLREREARPSSSRMRIGFVGGMSHGGDLELLRDAMTSIGDTDVTWVFMGMSPENPACRIEFHEGVPVVAYLDVMAQLDIDLMLAPLENNNFNKAKSNLRLLEAAACGAAVVAQDLEPYRLDKPPVFAYAGTQREWTTAIRQFLAAPQAVRQRSADALRSWVGRKYTLERMLPTRADAWLPAKRWRPSPAKDFNASPRLATLDAQDAIKRMPFLRQLDPVTQGLEEACRAAVNAGTDVLWLRPATTMTENGWFSLRATLMEDTHTASAVPLASDGANGFPQIDRWGPMPVDSVRILDNLVKELFSGRRLQVPVPSGPVVLLARHALAMLGIPDVVGCDGNEEQAILEWGCRAASRQWKHAQAVNCFAASLAPPAQPTQKSAYRLQARGISDWLQVKYDGLSPDERERLEIGLLRQQWGGPRPGSAGFDNSYESWSALRATQQRRLRTDMVLAVTPSIAAVKLGTTISTAYLAEWIVFVDESVTLQDDALVQFAEAAVDTDASVIYADHESLVGDKRAPEFKPDFDLELFLAQDYITPICAVRPSALSWGLPPGDRAELYAALLRFKRKDFLHIPRILGSMVHNTVPEQQALETLSRQVAIQEFYGDTVKVTAHKHIMGCLSVVRRWQSECIVHGAGCENPDDMFPLDGMVSIIIPTLGSSRLIQPCVATILQHTTYPNYEIIVVQNGERAEPELSPRTLADPHVRWVYYDGPFNWSTINNWAIRKHAKGQFIVTLNDDINVSTKWWLNNMMGQAIQDDVGAVGARLLHPMGVVQHVGVVCHHGIAGHMHKGLQNGQAGHLGRALLTHEASAVTGACMLFSRANFDRVEGFREDLSHNYGDTAFCLALRDLGLRNVVEMSSELLHPEGASRPSGNSPEGFQKLIDEGKELAKLCSGEDPYWSPNLAVGLIQNGLAIQGLNAESLAWEDFRPRPDASRVLLVNDLPGKDGLALGILADNDIPYSADLSGFRMRLTAPNAINMQVWDIRNPVRIEQALIALGIDRVVLRSLIGVTDAAPPVEALRAFGVMAIPVEIEPTETWQITPWCHDDDWEKALKVFGAVDVQAWKQAYESYVGKKEAMQ